MRKSLRGYCIVRNVYGDKEKLIKYKNCVRLKIEYIIFIEE